MRVVFFFLKEITLYPIKFTSLKNATWKESHFVSGQLFIDCLTYSAGANLLYLYF